MTNSYPANYFYDDLWDRNPLPYIVIDSSLNIIAANNAALKLLKYRREDLDERPLTDLTDPAEASLEKITRLFESTETKNSTSEIKIALYDAKGIRIPLLLTSTFSSDNNHLLIALQDITEAEKNNETIGLLESIIDTVRNLQITSAKERTKKKMLDYFCSYLHKKRNYRAVWIAIFNREGKLSDFSESGLGVFPLEEKIRDGERCCCLRKAKKHSGVVTNIDDDDECNDCSLASIFGNTICMAIRLESLGRFYGVITVHLPQQNATITEQNLLQSISKDISLVLHSYEVEETRKEAEIEREKALKMKSDFIALASHQLRTPLTTLKEGINILLDELAGDLNEEQRNFITALRRNSNRIDRVVNDILMLQKLETGIVRLDLQHITIEDLLLELEPTVSKKVLLSRIDVRYSINDKNHRILCDSKYLLIVLRTILSKMIQYSENCDVEVTFSKKDSVSFIQFDLLHTSLSYQDQVSHFQEPSITYRISHNSDELMIDMAICHEIVKQHSGKITVKDRKDKGMTVTVTLQYDKKFGASDE